MKINLTSMFICGLLFGCIYIGTAQEIQYQSAESLYVEVGTRSGKTLGSGTGFIIRPDSIYYLITNWHVVTNRSPWTGGWIDSTNMIEPELIAIRHRSSKGFSYYNVDVQELIDSSGDRQFKEFHYEDKIVDVIALPLKENLSPEIKIYPLDYKNTFEGVPLMPSDVVTVIGYPLGFSSNLAFPIYKSGAIASEPQINQEGLPIIWVDLLGFGGMSGSPVYYFKETYDPKRNNFITGARFNYFIGVFSHGKPNIQLGALWKSTFLEKIFDNLD